MSPVEAAHIGAIKMQEERNTYRWSDYTRTPAEHLLILTEEVGEVARAMQGGAEYIWPPAYSKEVYRELVDVGAVVLAMMKACEGAL